MTARTKPRWRQILDGFLVGLLPGLAVSAALILCVRHICYPYFLDALLDRDVVTARLDARAHAARVQEFLALEKPEDQAAIKELDRYFDAERLRTKLIIHYMDYESMFTFTAIDAVYANVGSGSIRLLGGKAETPLGVHSTPEELEAGLRKRFYPYSKQPPKKKTFSTSKTDWYFIDDWERMKFGYELASIFRAGHGLVLVNLNHHRLKDAREQMELIYECRRTTEGQ